MDADIMKIMVVDDDPTMLCTSKKILAPFYDLSFATSAAGALELLQMELPDLLLLDVVMPQMDGYELCSILKSNPDTNAIPVIFVTSRDNEEDEEIGLSLGAVDYIRKPYRPKLLLARIKTHLELFRQRKICQGRVDRATAGLRRGQSAAVFMLGEAGHYRDNDTGAHVWRMAAYATLLAHASGWPMERVELMSLAAPLHDTGKIGIPDAILKAPRALTEEEWVIMKTHTTIGYNILSKSNTPVFDLAAEIALSHHEKWNGSGYPGGKAGEAIPESARIAAIADVFDALTMKRPYKKNWEEEKSIRWIDFNSGSHFDPNLAALFDGVSWKISMVKQYFDRREAEGHLLMHQESLLPILRDELRLI